MQLSDYAKQGIFIVSEGLGIAANLFRATQTDEKLRRKNIKGKQYANKIHFQLGKKIRQALHLFFKLFSIYLALSL